MVCLVRRDIPPRWPDVSIFSDFSQLSCEKSQLEASVSSSSRAVERMSQNVEELQWRIRNNFDLPIVHHQNPSRDDQPVSLPVYMPQ